MFFSKFPTTTYDLDLKTKLLVTDIIRAIKIDPNLKHNDIYYYEYDAKDDETPEIISHKAYKSTLYHWVIMLINDKFDPWNDFPKNDIVLQKMTIDKYGSLNGVHHYEDEQGYIVDELSSGIPITNIEYIRKENEAKRKVKILKREVLADFVSQYQALISV